MKTDFRVKREKKDSQKNMKKKWTGIAGTFVIIFVINSCSSPNTLVEMPEVIAPSWEESKGIRAGNWDIEDSYEEIAVEVKPENKIVVVTPEPVKTKTDTTKTASDYILQDSSSRLLTRSDVEKLGLSLREINYAKNEIYARHGRKFNSMELQNYFNSKSWYRGTVEPEAFGENILSDIEKKNVELLRDIEFGINPNGYPLDSN